MERRPYRQTMTCVLSLVAAAVSLAPALALAQGRGSFNVGTLRSVGSQSGFGSSTFRNYSYGLGGTAESYDTAPAPGMQGPALRPSGGGAAALTAPGMSPQRPDAASASRRIYTPTEFNFRTSGGGSVAREFNQMIADRVVFGEDLNTTFGLTASPLATEEPIRSFAPNNAGRYATYLRTGQDTMKVAQYTQAAEHFRQAAFIGPKRPETLLSLAHADLGAGRYASMAHYLRLAIRHTPDLPSRDIRLRGFFRDINTFLTLRDQLIAQTEAFPNDANVWMALGYLLWYDSDTARAAEAWRHAYSVSIDPAVSEAIEGWWDGAVATGRISGPLETPPAAPPAAVPAPQSPTDAAAEDDGQPPLPS
ncbi:MAG: hypothetical protein GX591_07605 [Planctomycetes bacterium]|nr:hypothetical protein [Planctomycetota bacterium]